MLGTDDVAGGGQRHWWRAFTDEFNGRRRPARRPCRLITRQAGSRCIALSYFIIEMQIVSIKACQLHKPVPAQDLQLFCDRN
jgi:hypothetical protein